MDPVQLLRMLCKLTQCLSLSSAAMVPCIILKLLVWYTITALSTLTIRYQARLWRLPSLAGPGLVVWEIVQPRVPA